MNTEEPKRWAKMTAEVFKRPNQYKLWQQTISLIAVFMIFAAATFYLILEVSKKPENLDVIGHLLPEDEDHYFVEGRVLFDGKPVNNALVWAVFKDSIGNKYSPEGDSTNENGEFIINSIPKTIATSPEATTYALAKMSHSKDLIKGKEPLRCSQRIIKLDILTIMVLPAIFIISFLVPFLTLNYRWKYGISITSAILFTFGMIVLVGAGLYHVNTNYSRDSREILSLGFASISQGRYVENVDSEWIISFTSPTIFADSIAADERIMRGFGAPLWILLIAAIGAGIFTVSIIVSEIKNRPQFSLLDSYYIEQVMNMIIASQQKESRKKKAKDLASQSVKKGAIENILVAVTLEYNKLMVDELNEFRSRLERIIRHQFYILFSPIGAIFVYQLLVIANAANNAVTVALAAFGAGASLNLILDKAVRYAEKAIGITEKKKGDTKK